MKMKMITIIIATLIMGILFSVNTLATPSIDFVNPTPPNDTTTGDTSIIINVSINESSLKEVVFTWNGTNTTIFEDNLILMFNFDNVSALGESYSSSDSIIIDLSISGKNGTTFQGVGANLVVGRYGNVLDFDGATDYMDTTLDIDQEGTVSHTFAFWAYPTSTSADLHEVISTSDGSFDWGVLRSAGSWAVFDGGGTWLPGASVDNNTWQHIVVVFNVTSSTATFYKDTILYGSPETITYEAADADVRIGKSRFGAQERWFAGSIDEVRIWSRALSPAEISQLYFINLNKYDVDKWTLYVNQSKNSTDGLDNGVYTYQAFASNSSDSWGQTDLRTITVQAGIPAPNITIDYPDNITYTINVSDLNYTVIELNPDSCWNSIDDGVTNSSSVSSGTNFTGVVSTEGGNTWTVYCNDTSNNIGNDNVSFTVLINPTWENNKTNLTTISKIGDSVYFNITLNDSNPDSKIFSLDNGSGVFVNDSSASYADGEEIEEIKTLVRDGTIRWKWYFNDTFGNSNQSDVWSVAIDSTLPVVTLRDPANNSVIIVSNRIIFEYNVTDTVSSIDNCSLIINGVLNKTDSTITKDVNLTIVQDFSDGTYNWSINCTDDSSNVGNSVTYNFSVTDTQPPTLSFVSPTPVNGSTSRLNTINTSITERLLGRVVFNWNGTNTSYYNSSLIFMVNLDNRSALEESDTKIVDVSAFERSGTCSGSTCPALATGKFGNAYRFDGGSDRFVFSDSDNSLDLTNELTFMAWINHDAVSGTDGIFGKSNDSTANYRFTVTGTGKLRLFWKDSSGENHAYDTNATISDGEWTHVAVTYNQTTAVMYINGTVQDFFCGSGNCSMPMIANDHSLTIGSAYLTNLYFDGLIDEVRIWNKTLSTAEVQQHYMGNLNKQNNEDWALYIAQTDSPNESLSEGTYNFRTYASDTLGQWNDTGLRTFTFSNVSIIELLSTLDPHPGGGGSYSDIWGYEAGGREYALMTFRTGLSIIDVTNSSNPIEVDFITGNDNIKRDVKTYLNFAYVVSDGLTGGDGLFIINLSNLPDNATFIKNITDDFDEAHNLWVDQVNGFLYVSLHNLGVGMLIYDLADPINPVLVNTYTDLGTIHDVYVKDNIMYAPQSGSGEFAVINDTNKTDLVVLGNSSYPGTFMHDCWPARGDQLILCTDEFNVADIVVYNKTNLSNITSTNPYNPDPKIHQVIIREDFAHLSYYASFGYVVLDVTDPNSPVELGTFDSTFGIWGVYPLLSSGIVIGSDRVNGLRVWRVNITPRWSQNSTNSTLAGTNILHSLRWVDNAVFDGHIVSFDNCTGTFVNDSFVSMSGGTDWSNFTKSVNSTVGCTSRWYVTVNDTQGLINVSPIFSYTTTAADSCTCPGAGNNWEINMEDNCETNTLCNLTTGNITFINTGNWYVNATIYVNSIGGLIDNQTGWIRSNAYISTII